MKETLRAALRLADVDYCEVRFEESEHLRIRFQGKGLDSVNNDINYGGCVRALHKGGWGFASFNDPAELEQAVRAACEQARFAGERKGGESRLAPVPVVEDEFVPNWTLNPRAVSLDDKLRILNHYNELMLNYHPDIVAAVIVYGEQITDLYFANTEGTYIYQQKLDIGSALMPTARRGDESNSQYVGLGSSIGFDCMLNADEQVKKACQIAVESLDAPQVKAGVYTVICDPALTGLFVHEAFGHLSEADDVYKNPDLAKAMTLGRRLGKDNLTIYDSGEYANNRGFLKYDDEGVATERTFLIKDGILVGRLHSRETAGAMAEKPTGSARAINYAFPPICRMRNTCIAPGDSTLEEMIKHTELGILACSIGGGGETNGEMFNFNAGYAYMIRDGKLAELVKDVALMGNVFTTLENIDMIGKDVEAPDGAGGCGKNQQAPLATGNVAPYIRIQNVIMGGAK